MDSDALKDAEDRRSHMHVVAATLRAAGMHAKVEGDYVYVCDILGPLVRYLGAERVREALAKDEIDELVDIQQRGPWVAVVVL